MISSLLQQNCLMANKLYSKNVWGKIAYSKYVYSKDAMAAVTDTAYYIIIYVIYMNKKTVLTINNIIIECNYNV